LKMPSRGCIDTRLLAGLPGLTERAIPDKEPVTA